jgi:DNA-directed RNA polymerase specialized sigma24 family protein
MQKPEKVSRRPARAWTDEEDARLACLVKTSTWAQIARAFDCHPDAARLRARTLGLRKHILSKADPGRDLIIFEYVENHGVKAAASYYRVTAHAIKAARRRVLIKRRRLSKAFTHKRFAKFRHACLGAARATGIGHDAEDFAGWAILKVLEGRNASVMSLAVDYARERYGRTDRKDSAREAKQAMRKAMPIKDDPDLEDPGVVIASPGGRDRGAMLFAVADKLELDSRARAVFLLYWKDDWRQDEIAEYFGVSPERIHQMLNIAKRRLAQTDGIKAMLAP